MPVVHEGKGNLAARMAALRVNAEELVLQLGDKASLRLRAAAPRDIHGAPHRLRDTIGIIQRISDLAVGVGPLSLLGDPEQKAMPNTIADFLTWYRQEMERQRGYKKKEKTRQSEAAQVMRQEKKLKAAQLLEQAAEQRRAIRRAQNAAAQQRHRLEIRRMEKLGTVMEKKTRARRVRSALGNLAEKLSVAEQNMTMRLREYNRLEDLFTGQLTQDLVGRKRAIPRAAVTKKFAQVKRWAKRVAIHEQKIGGILQELESMGRTKLQSGLLKLLKSEFLIDWQRYDPLKDYRKAATRWRKNKGR